MYLILLLIQKLNERKAVFMKGKYSDDIEKEMWSKVLQLEVMSSEESAIEDEEEVMLVKPLTWLSDSVLKFKKTLDERIVKEKSSLARRQMKKRLQGMPSTRPMPDGLPQWAIAE